MRAGLLREWCELYGEVTTQSRSGAVKKVDTLIRRVKCYRCKRDEQAKTAGGEEVTKGMMILQVRGFEGIKNAKRFVYDGDKYTIIKPMDRQVYDGTYKIKGILINE